jgi:TetR/AcrR family transcriptional regulator, transcriptional repressor for nem operon
MTSRQAGRVGTSTRILDTAERVVQTKGFGRFSYADVASELSITKAALHYHYPGKAELGDALVARYSMRFAEALAATDAAGGSALVKLDAYIGLYAEIVSQQRMCLCGMLAAEYESLPAPMQAEVVRFFDRNAHWLERVLEQGRSEGTIQFARSARDTALMIISAVEGAMLVTRPYGDIEKFRSTAAAVLSGLYGTREPAGPTEPAGPPAPAGTS